MGYSNIRKLSTGDILLLNEQHRYVIRRIGSYASFEELLLYEDPALIAPDLPPKQLLPAMCRLYPPEKEELGVIALEIVRDNRQVRPAATTPASTVVLLTPVQTAEK